MKRILVVDDNPDIRKMLQITFASVYEIDQACDAQAALELIRQNPPDAVILDIMMPGGMDGYALCKLLKSDPRWAKLVIVLLSARGQATDRQKGIEVGADAYVVKPFSPFELMGLIQRLLAEK